MEGVRFDRLTRRVGVGMDRRSALRLAGIGVVASLASVVGIRSDVAAQQFGADACVPNGRRCGRRNQPKCRKCCTRNTIRQNNGQRRCACRQDFQVCRRSDQCCTGSCQMIDKDPSAPMRCTPSSFGPA